MAETDLVLYRIRFNEPKPESSPHQAMPAIEKLLATVKALVRGQALFTVCIRAQDSQKITLVFREQSHG